MLLIRDKPKGKRRQDLKFHVAKSPEAPLPVQQPRGTLCGRLFWDYNTCELGLPGQVPFGELCVKSACQSCAHILEKQATK